MPSPVAASRRWTNVALLALVASHAFAQQSSTQDPAPPSAQFEAAQAAAERWLADGQDRAVEVEKVVAELAVDRKAAIAWLATQLAQTDVLAKTPRSRALLSLATLVALDFVAWQRATNMVFVGQYDGLQPLQPFVTDRFFELLLAPPPWFSIDRRVHLVAPLRDLQLRTPPAERLEAVIRIVENERQEPTDLRRALTAALWQWGTREPGQRIVAELQQGIADGTAEDRVRASLELADYYVLLREYKRAANLYRTAQALSKNLGVPLRPVAWYAAACVHALLGEQELGLQAIERCAELLADPNLDASWRLERKALEDDPELAALRKDPRFAAAMAKAFAKPADEKAPSEPKADGGGRDR
jgi:hypothetical protein